jgi:hypothetical protein
MKQQNAEQKRLKIIQGEKTANLDEIASTLQELNQMYQLNLELIENLAVTYAFIADNNIPIPNEEKFNSLLNKVRALLREMYLTEKRQIVQYRKVSRRKVTDFRNDGEVTEPLKPQ